MFAANLGVCGSSLRVCERHSFLAFTRAQRRLAAPMGCGANQKQTAESKAVEKQLKDDAKALNSTIKLLLLGAPHTLACARYASHAPPRAL